MIGKTISHYKILEKLGEGGMGVVYKAHDAQLDRDVALKFLPQFLTSDPSEKERFYHEARAASALNHPNITTVHEISEHEGQLFIAMELVEGKTLKQLVVSESLSVKKVLDITIQVGEGLTAAHEKEIVHRDIKSENIIVTPKGQAKIMDFGLAKVKGATKLTKTGSTLGTAAYMSPEQARGEEVDHRSDIFSFGVVLYELLTGRLPFKGEHQAALIYSIVNEEPQPVARFNEKTTPEMEHIVSKSLAKDKEDRYQHIDDLLADLRHERKKIEYPKGEHIPTAMPLKTFARKRQYLKYMLSIAGIILLIILVNVFNPFKKPLRQKEIASAGEKSIAVLPFVDMSQQKDQEYFCDGMTEELINRLSNVRYLKIPSRTSAFMFKGKTQDIKDIGEKLKVKTILEGSVRKSGNKLRITAQLIDVDNGYHLWSNTYDRELKDVFAIQDEIASSIVNALKLELTSQEKRNLFERPIDNEMAFEYYLKAKNEINKETEDAIDRAIQYLQNGINIVGDNALLYSGMASAYWQYVNIGVSQEEYIKKVEEYATKALAIDPNLSNAHSVLGQFYRDFRGNPKEAIRQFNMALTINPNQSSALMNLAYMYIAMLGKKSPGIPLIERFKQVEPLSPYNYAMQGFLYLYEGQYGLALEEFQKEYQLNPKAPNAQFNYALILTYNKELAKAYSIIDESAEKTPNNVLTKFCILLKFGLLKNKEKAFQEMTPDFQKTCKRDPGWSYNVAIMLSLLDEKKEALNWLENAVNRGFINYPWLKREPFIENIRGEEQFKKLMERIKKEWDEFEV